MEEVTLPAGTEVFGDPHLCDPLITISCLNYCAQQLVESGHVAKVLLAWVWEDHTSTLMGEPL